MSAVPEASGADRTLTGYATMVLARVRRSGHAPGHAFMAFGPADRDGTNQNKDRTWKGPSVKLWVTAPAATFPLSPVNPTGITIINVK